MDLVTVRRFETHWQAALAQNRLEQEGIQSFLQQQESQVMEGPFNNSVGGVQLQVQQQDASRTQTLLEGMQFSDPKDEAESLICLSCGQPMSEDNNQCPACGWSYQAGSVPAEAADG